MISDIRHFFTLALIISFCGLYPFQSAQAQSYYGNDDTQTSYSFSSSLYASTSSSLPFWFYSNVNGKVDPSGTNWLNEISVNHRLWNSGNWQVNVGGDALFRVSENSQVLIPKAYLQAKAHGLQLDAGRFNQPIGLNNHELSLGSMMVSNNAMPLPRISISTPDFMDVPLMDGYLQYKGMFSHGWLEEDRFVRNAYLHQKYFYLRVNIGSWSGMGGIVHNVQWGGTHPNLGRLPRSFGDFLRVVTGRAASESSNAPGSDLTNVIGNSLAAYEFGLRYERETFTASLTRLFYLEDKVSTRFRSPWDGVWGVNLEFKDTNRLIKTITYEHVNSKQMDSKSWELIGAADYYDHSVYRHGWTYENDVIGIPLILFENDDIVNNVLVAHHLGISGQPTEHLSYKALLTYSRNYGIQDDWVENPGKHIPQNRPDVTPREQFRKDQYSVLLGLDYDIRNVEGLAVNLKLSSDLGELYEDRFGVMLGLSWGR
ncbi:capsule assembly Wzi family protein [Fodinibius sp.]|uniref:capsule assembly Wzi family protein n=1 Tax=Fodinibius sp. TaxID=1872440 RepID=UPI002ACD70F3|nr:capsule assembly Wzi family protein [Fodinibius sp.]MDZ7657654.1 capsule assembly Wzi family protein [Fodinibius sp.]